MCLLALYVLCWVFVRASFLRNPKKYWDFSLIAPCIPLYFLGMAELQINTEHMQNNQKPPPPTVPPMQHAGALESAERATPRHRAVRQGGGEEAPTDGGNGDLGEFREGLPGLWEID